VFSGIVHSVRPIVDINMGTTFGTIAIDLGNELAKGLVIGASVSVDGVCLTVTAIDNVIAHFDVIVSTLERTNLGNVALSRLVNIERSLSTNAEIGGHEVSGHVDFTGTLVRIEATDSNRCLHFKAPEFWMRYLFPHGFVAINGVSLTISDIRRESCEFTVWLIPETLRRTNLQMLQHNDTVNIEVHRGVQVVVDTIEATVEKLLRHALKSGELDAQQLTFLQKSMLRLPGSES